MPNPDDIFEGSHAEFAFFESYVPPSEKIWLKWVNKVEKLLGHSLDGNQDEEGYSLDFAYDEHMNGLSPEQYVAEVRANPIYTGRHP